MKNLLSVVKISVPDQVYLKDPETSDLGKRIIENSTGKANPKSRINLLDESLDNLI